MSDDQLDERHGIQPAAEPRLSRYDPVAQWYHDWVAAPNDDPVAASLLRMLPAVSKKRILDVGCGQGRIARHMAVAGAAVVAVELSAELLLIAKQEATRGITYVHADVCTTAWWDGVPFDGAVASMALMDIDDLDGVLKTVAKVLIPGGWFAWSIIHPVFPGIDRIRPSWPTHGSYFDEGWWNTDGDGVRGRVGSNHRTLSTYFNAAIAQGFALEALDEPPWQLDAMKPALPFFLVSRWRRTRDAS